MVRKCSHCSHNSSTCIDTRGVVKLFGVQFHMASWPLEESFSMEYCLSCSHPFAPSSSSSASSEKTTTNGYLSDGLGGRKQERKKGVSWTEEEHRKFLAGLEKLGRGDWRGISRNFVNTRTPTQVASHAQKYFLRQNSVSKQKRRSSLFDVVATREKAALDTDPYKSEIEVHEERRKKRSETAKVDLSSSIRKQEERINAELSHIDLELRISSSKLNQKNSSTGNLCFGTP